MPRILPVRFEQSRETGAVPGFSTSLETNGLGEGY
jgi:hypothetical protein